MSSRILFALCSLLFPLCALAQEGGYLERLAATMRALEPYEATFVMEGEGLSVVGSYAVEGSRYRITLPEAAVWGEEGLRYEVDHRRRTITLMPVDTTSRNLLDNPSRAFDFVAADYQMELVQVLDQEVQLRLSTEADPLTTIYLTLDRSTARPRAVRYEIDGIGVDLRLTALQPATKPLPKFAPGDYAEYEVVDFR